MLCARRTCRRPSGRCPQARQRTARAPEFSRSPFFLAVERAKSGANLSARNLGRTAMRHPRLSFTHLVAAALVIAGVFAPASIFAQAQPPAQAPAPAPAPAPPLGPYKPVAITLPPSVNDPSFEIFRKQLSDIAKNKDRAALARVVAANFFWVPEDKDIADKQKPAIDNLSKALSLDGPDGFGWDVLADFAAETTTMT